MEAAEMTSLEENSARFTQWLGDALLRLNETNSADVHIDELSDERLDAHESIDRALNLFRWVLVSLAQPLAGKLVMLMIPLQNSDELDSRVPRWESLSAQLSRTPPSLYVMNITSFLQHDSACRYVASMSVPGEPNRAYYQCWRQPTDDEEDDGWMRDVRMISMVVPRA